MSKTSSFYKEISFLVLVMGCSYLSSILIFNIFETQNPNIHSILDISWWWVVTSSTVGYGDIVPITLAGRMEGTFVIVIGILSYTYTISLVLNRVNARLNAKERGKAPIKAENHILICEYTAFADEMLQELPSTILKDKDVVLLTTLVERTPYENVKFVYGVPINPAALKESHADKATHIFVFSNNRFFEPDSKTLHIVSRIMQINKTAKIYAELSNPQNPMLNELSRKVHVMSSEKLVHAALQQKHIRLNQILENSHLS